MAFGIGDRLSVTLSARTSDFTRGMEVAQSLLNDVGDESLATAGALEVLQNRANEAGDELTRTGERAAVASGGLASYSAGADGAAASSEGLTGVLLVSLIPSIVILSAALVPVVSALAGFVAIAGAIGAVGLGGILGAYATHTEELKSQLQDLLDTVKTVFGPVFDAAFTAIEALIGDFQSMLDTLSFSDKRLNEIASLFEQLGSAVINQIPAFIDLALSLTREFLPPLVRMARNILPKMPGIIKGFVAEFRRLAPMFMAAGRMLGRLLPQLLEFGNSALTVVAPALGTLGNILIDALSAFNSLSDGTKNAVLQLGLMAPVLVGLTSLLGGLSAPILVIAGLITALYLAWQQNFGGIRQVVSQFASQIQSVLGDNLPTLISNLKQIWKTIRPVVEPLFNFLIRALGTGIVNAVDLVVSAVTALSQLLTGDFSGALDTIAGALQRVFGRSLDLVAGQINTLIKTFIDVVNTVGNLAQDAASKIPGINFDFQALNAQDYTIANSQAPQPTVKPGVGLSPNGQNTQVNVNVTGDTGVIRDVSTEVIRGKERAVTRSQGTNSPL